MCKSGCAVVTPFSTLICLQLYDVVPPKYSKVVTQCVTLVTLLSHWLQLCEEQSHVTGDGRALAPKRQKPQKTGNHAAAGDRNPTGELDRNQTEITEIHQKSFFTSHPQIVNWERPLITDVFTKALITSSETGRTNVKH